MLTDLYNRRNQVVDRPVGSEEGRQLLDQRGATAIRKEGKAQTTYICIA